MYYSGENAAVYLVEPGWLKKEEKSVLIWFQSMHTDLLFGKLGVIVKVTTYTCIYILINTVRLI